jgi:hypothetical protein
MSPTFNSLPVAGMICMIRCAGAAATHATTTRPNYGAVPPNIIAKASDRDAFVVACRSAAAM